jgi:hypothetical protein
MSHGLSKAKTISSRTFDDMCIHYDGERVAANEALIAEINARGLRESTRQTKLDSQNDSGNSQGKESESLNAREGCHGAGWRVVLRFNALLEIPR